MEQRKFTDTAIPAYFQAANKPFKISPHRNATTGQVEFIVEAASAEIDAALTELYENAPVGALDFIRNLKGLRSSIFALKGVKNV